MGCGDWTVKHLLNTSYEKCKYTGAGDMGECVVYVNKTEVKLSDFWFPGANRLRRNALQLAGENTLDYNTR